MFQPVSRTFELAFASSNLLHPQLRRFTLRFLYQEALENYGVTSFRASAGNDHLGPISTPMCVVVREKRIRRSLFLHTCLLAKPMSALSLLVLTTPAMVYIC